MPPKGQPRDPNLDHPGVKLYREIVRLTPNWIQRRDIALTVHVDTPGELSLWEQIVTQFMREGRNPKRVDWICDRFETALRNGFRKER